MQFFKNSFPIIGDEIANLEDSTTTMEKMIAVKTCGTEFLSNPQIVYNLNMGHFLVTFKSIQATNRNTAFAVYVPAQKELVLIAGHKGFVIKSFEQFQLTMKQQILIDITITAKDLN